MAGTSTDIFRTITNHRDDLSRFHVASLSVFGSVARGEDSPESDVDFLVEFDRPVGMFHFIRLKMFLESILGRSVDLVTQDALKAGMRDQILRDAIRAA